MEHAVWIYSNLAISEEVTKKSYGLDLKKKPYFGTIKSFKYGYYNLTVVRC